MLFSLQLYVHVCVHESVCTVGYGSNVNGLQKTSYGKST
jgi:hypothetical protein